MRRIAISLAGLVLAALHVAGQPITIYPGAAGDTGYSSPPGISTTAYTVLQPISATPPGTNVTTMRYGSDFTYSFLLAGPGIYTVTMYFVEPCSPIACGGWINAPGQRVFSVAANDQPILSNLDLFAAAGSLVATARAALIAVPGNTLNLRFTASVRNAVISAITISGDLIVSGALQCTGPSTCSTAPGPMLYGHLGGATLSGWYWMIPVPTGWTPASAPPSTWAAIR